MHSSKAWRNDLWLVLMNQDCYPILTNSVTTQLTFFNSQVLVSLKWHYYYIPIAQGPSGPDLAPRTHKVPVRRSPESSVPMLFETWNHLKPLETTCSLIWGLLATLAFFAILATFCQFGDFGNFLAIFLAHFDPWAICDNSLQWHFLIGPAA